MKKTMVALKDFSYSTRRLKAGDEFKVTHSDARVLAAIGRASEVPPALATTAINPNFKIPPPPAPPAAQVQQSTPPAPPAAQVQQSTTPAAQVQQSTTPTDDDGDENPLKTVRDEYEQVVGKRPFHGWDEAELRRRMAEHQSS